MHDGVSPPLGHALKQALNRHPGPSPYRLRCNAQIA